MDAGEKIRPTPGRKIARNLEGFRGTELPPREFGHLALRGVLVFAEVVVPLPGAHLLVLDHFSKLLELVIVINKTPRRPHERLVDTASP